MAPLLEHLAKLSEDSTEGRTKDKKRVIHWLFLKHQGIFSQNENDLGQTNLVEQTIETGDVKPIKQLTHHLPMSFMDVDHEDLAEKDIPKMAFTTEDGLCEFTAMLFGLMTSPTTYH